MEYLFALLIACAENRIDCIVVEDKQIMQICRPNAGRMSDLNKRTYVIEDWKIIVLDCLPNNKVSYRE